MRWWVLEEALEAGDKAGTLAVLPYAPLCITLVLDLTWLIGPLIRVDSAQSDCPCDCRVVKTPYRRPAGCTQMARLFVGSCVMFMNAESWPRCLLCHMHCAVV